MRALQNSRAAFHVFSSSAVCLRCCSAVISADGGSLLLLLVLVRFRFWSCPVVVVVLVVGGNDEETSFARVSLPSSMAAATSGSGFLRSNWTRICSCVRPGKFVDGCTATRLKRSLCWARMSRRERRFCCRMSADACKDSLSVKATVSEVPLNQLLQLGHKSFKHRKCVYCWYFPSSNTCM